MEICDLYDNKFQIIISRKLSELQENIESQFEEVRKTMHEQNSKFIREIEIIKKNQTNSEAEEYHEWNERYNSEDQQQTWSSRRNNLTRELEERSFEIIQSENKEKRMGKLKKASVSYGITSKATIYTLL